MQCGKGSENRKIYLMVLSVRKRPYVASKVHFNHDTRMVTNTLLYFYLFSNPLKPWAYKSTFISKDSVVGNKS